MKITIMKNIMEGNQLSAADNRRYFKDRNIFTINIMASPGAGKTSVILNLIKAMPDVNIGVVEGDTASSIDSEKIEKLGIKVIQINTGDDCHLNAPSIYSAVNELNITNGVVLIENIGNLICPSAFDLGENLKILIASVPEGADKPYKYLSMFEAADIIVLNKCDLMPYVDFDYEYFKTGVMTINPNAKIISVSCSDGSGIEDLVFNVREYLKND